MRCLVPSATLILYKPESTLCSSPAKPHLNGGHDDHDTADVGMDMDMGTKITVMPGKTESLIFTFDDPEEQSLVVCLLPGHYEAGMWSEIA